MSWFIFLPLALAWFIFAIAWQRTSRSLPVLIRWLFVLIIFGSIIGLDYVRTEFIVNKGPEDWGSVWHARHPLSAKYGKLQHCSYTIQSFDKDADGSGSGTYHVRFKYNGNTGVILCHYDKAIGKFDRDEIDSDK